MCKLCRHCPEFGITALRASCVPESAETESGRAPGLKNASGQAITTFTIHT